MIKILFLAANPLNTEMLRLDEEMRAIDAALRQSELRTQIDLRSHWAVRIHDLQELFLRHQPDIVHFSGHGTHASEIILQDNFGQGLVVPASALSSLFAIFQKHIRCVLLNACYSAEQASAISEHVDAVVGMSDAISDTAALQFSTAFYRAIGYGQDVLTAFHLGCNQLDLSNMDEAEIPQLRGKAEPDTVRFPTRNGGQESLLMEQPQTGEQRWWDQLPESTPHIETEETSGDVIIATIGAGAKNVAVGKDIHQVITEVLGEPDADDKAQIESQIGNLQKALTALQGKVAEPALQMANMQIQLLEGELIKTEEGQIPSASTITQIGSWLLDNIPELFNALVLLFATPAVGRVLGKADENAVAWVQQRLGQ